MCLGTIERQVGLMRWWDLLLVGALAYHAVSAVQATFLSLYAMYLRTIIWQVDIMRWWGVLLL